MLHWWPICGRGKTAWWILFGPTICRWLWGLLGMLLLRDPIANLLNYIMYWNNVPKWKTWGHRIGFQINGRPPRNRSILRMHRFVYFLLQCFGCRNYQILHSLIEINSWHMQNINHMVCISPYWVGKFPRIGTLRFCLACLGNPCLQRDYYHPNRFHELLD